MPNLASRYQSGTCHPLSDSRVPLNRPDAISSATPDGWVNDFRDNSSAGTPAITESAFLRLIFNVPASPQVKLQDSE